jgi:hypothetical protein
LKRVAKTAGVCLSCNIALSFPRTKSDNIHIVEGVVRKTPQTKKSLFFLLLVKRKKKEMKGELKTTRRPDGRLRFVHNNQSVCASDMCLSDLIKWMLAEDVMLAHIDDYEFDEHDDPMTLGQRMNYLRKIGFAPNMKSLQAYSPAQIEHACKWYLTGAPLYLLTNTLENVLIAQKQVV